MFWGVSAAAWSAIAAFLSFVAAAALVFVAFRSNSISRDIRDVSKDVRDATHTPIVAVATQETKPDGYSRHHLGHLIPIYFNLFNVGNSPAIQIYFAYVVYLGTKEILGPKRFFEPFIRTDEEKGWEVITLKFLFDGYKEKTGEDLFPEDEFDKNGEFECDLDVKFQVWHRNHAGQYFETVTKSHYTLSLGMGRKPLIHKNWWQDEFFDPNEITKDKYDEAIKQFDVV